MRTLPARPPVDVRAEFRELRIDPGLAEQLRATHCVPLGDVSELDGVWVEPLACVLRAAESVAPDVCSWSAWGRWVS